MEIDIKGGYRIKSLSIDDIDDVDDLNKRCTDFYMLHDGIMPAKDDAVEIFTSLPPGNTYDDKYVLGIYNMAEKLIGIIDIVKDYPEKGRWIIGLLIIDPEERGKGIGRVVHEELYRWVESLGALSLRVVVINDNMNGFKFWSSLGYRTKKESVRDYKAKKHAIHIMELNIG